MFQHVHQHIRLPFNKQRLSWRTEPDQKCAKTTHTFLTSSADTRFYGHFWSKLIEAHIMYLFLFFRYFLGLFVPLFLGQETGQREGEWHAAKGHRWNRTRVCCSEDIASVYGAPALPTEPLGAPFWYIFDHTQIRGIHCMIWHIKEAAEDHLSPTQ